MAFFLPKQSFFSKQDIQPYVIGFNHSRPDDSFAFSFRFEASKYQHLSCKYQHLSCKYQHPSCAKDGRERYCFEFDYYNLDIILLEIGLWHALEHIISKINIYFNSKVQKKFIESRVSFFEKNMSVTYRDAVRTCFEKNFVTNVFENERQHDSKSVHLNFEKLIISPLKKC